MQTFSVKKRVVQSKPWYKFAYKHIVFIMGLEDEKINDISEEIIKKFELDTIKNDDFEVTVERAIEIVGKLAEQESSIEVVRAANYIIKLKWDE